MIETSVRYAEIKVINCVALPFHHRYADLGDDRFRRLTCFRRFRVFT